MSNPCATAVAAQLRAAEKADPRSSGFPQEGHPLLRHHHPAQGQARPRHADRRAVRTLPQGRMSTWCWAWKRAALSSAPALAYRLNAGFVPLRKPGKLPAATAKFDYALEYGTNTLEIHKDAIQKGQRVLIVDDLLATGGTAEATAKLAQFAGRGNCRAGIRGRTRFPEGPRQADRATTSSRCCIIRSKKRVM